eukprot:Opistho-2@88205
MRATVVVVCVFLLSVVASTSSSVIPPEQRGHGFSKMVSLVSVGDRPPLDDDDALLTDDTLAAYDKYRKRNFKIVPGMTAASDADGWFDDAVNQTGWGEFRGSSNPSLSALKQGFAVGFLEGALTYERIHQAYANFVAATGLPSTGALPDKVSAYVLAQNAYLWDNVNKSLESFANNDEGDDGERAFWIQVGVVLAQAEGIYAGYAHSAPSENSLTQSQVYALTLAGDLEDLLPALSGMRSANANDDTEADLNTAVNSVGEKLKDWPVRVTERMDCSGLVKLDPVTGKLLVGHSTFNMYSYLLRIFKHYTMDLSRYGAVSTTTSFSARPADLNSKDDFYLLDSGLVVMETSLSVFNKSLYAQLTPNSVPSWIRCQVANRLADSGSEWARIFALHNSGTHNNQWIVTDLKRSPSKMWRSASVSLDSLENGIVWIAEQMPGTVVSADVTTTLLATQLYVPSYNVPYFPEIFNLSGYRDAGFSYDKDPRASMFRRDHPLARDLASMGALMRQNRGAEDPLSGSTPCNAICARCDLQAQGGYAFGCIDTKVVDEESASEGRILAVAGPTHDQQPVFSFGSAWASVPHEGLPDSFPFDWVWMDPLA